MVTRERLHIHYVLVLVGDHRATRRMAFQLFWQYGLICHVFSKLSSLMLRILPFTVYHPLPRECNGCVSTLALSDFAGDILETDRQPLLILCEGTPEELDIRALESHYVICHPEQLTDVLDRFIQSTQGEQSL